MNRKYFPLLVAGVLTLATTGSAQVLNKLKNKSEQKAGDAIDNLFSGKKKKEQSSNQNQGNGQNSDPNSQSKSNGNSNSNPSNKGGGGLISSPPDVKQNLADAEVAYKKNSYGEARYSVQQAMLGIELEIGNKILKS